MIHNDGTLVVELDTSKVGSFRVAVGEAVLSRGAAKLVGTGTLGKSPEADYSPGI